MFRSRLAALLLVGIGVTSSGVAPEAPSSEGSVDEVAAQVAPASEDRGEVAVIAEFLASRGTGLEPDARRLARAIVSEAVERDLEPALVLAVIEVESHFRPQARSTADAFGLMQIRPRTGEALARRIGLDWRGHATLFDPVSNVRLGVAYLGELRDRFGHLSTALAAYNWGPSRIGRRLGRGAPVPAAYADRVLDAHRTHLRRLERS